MITCFHQHQHIPTPHCGLGACRPAMQRHLAAAKTGCAEGCGDSYVEKKGVRIGGNGDRQRKNDLPSGYESHSHGKSTINGCF